jgi:hypothetical protein
MRITTRIIASSAVLTGIFLPGCKGSEPEDHDRSGLPTASTTPAVTTHPIEFQVQVSSSPLVGVAPSKLLFAELDGSPAESEFHRPN